MSTANETVTTTARADPCSHSNSSEAPVAPISVCPLCCEESSANAADCVILSSCQHQSCRACLVRWIEREESSGRTEPPSCPFCRSAIGDEDVRTILGRSFMPMDVAVRPSGNGAEDEIDEFTLQWISEHTVPCGGCGSCIEKADGCDLIECLCGYRFCYSCGAARGSCGCNPGHTFLNGDYVDERQHIQDEPVRDGRGRVDLASCIRRRKVRGERERRAYARAHEELERSDYSAENAAVCDINGRWLFSSARSAACIVMLRQQISHGCVREDREYERHQRAMENRLEYQEDNAAASTSNGRWLFSSKNNDAGVAMAVQQLRHESIGERRRYQRYEEKEELSERWNDWERNNAICASDGSWLFSSTKNTMCILKLMTYFNPLLWEVRQDRAYKKAQRDEEEAKLLDYWEQSPAICTSNGRWLFSSKHSTVCVSMLVKQLNHEIISPQRQYDEYVTRCEADECLEQFNASLCTTNGAWLFTSAQDAACIMMLKKQLCPSRRQVQQEREWQRSQESYEGWLEQECEDYAGVCTSNGSWLFSSAEDAACIFMLTKQLCPLRMDIRNERECQREEREYEEVEEHSEDNIDICTSIGRWLFYPQKNSESLFMVTKQLCPERMQVRLQRQYLREQNEMEVLWEWKCKVNGDDTFDGVGSWLFSSAKRTVSISMLREQLQCNWI